MSSMKLKSLAVEYLVSKSKAEKAKKEEEAAKAHLLKELGIETGQLTKEDYQVFQTQKTVIEGVCDVSLYSSHTQSWNKDYLLSILTPEQITEALKMTYYSAAKVTSKLDIEDSGAVHVRKAAKK